MKKGQESIKNFLKMSFGFLAVILIGVIIMLIIGYLNERQLETEQTESGWQEIR